MLNGCSNWLSPIQVNVCKPATNSQTRHWLRGWKARLQCLDVWSIGIMARTKMQRIRARMSPLSWEWIVGLHEQIGSPVLAWGVGECLRGWMLYRCLGLLGG